MVIQFSMFQLIEPHVKYTLLHSFNKFVILIHEMFKLKKPTFANL